MDVQLLHPFLVVADMGSLTAAARHLGYSQPALSHRIAALERQVGCSLFVRDPHGMSLTERGTAMVPYAVAAVAVVAEMLELVSVTPCGGRLPAHGPTMSLPPPLR